MSLELKIIFILAFLVIILFLLWRRAASGLSNVKFQKQSLASKYGKLTEQFLPFLNQYPYDPQNFRFIGTPIDGIQFEDDGIIIMEFKTAGGRLSPKQQKIQELVENRKIYFKQINIK
ncbi:MAG: Holliday junction resolvase-like protein [bacterium]|nr:Holliday junction resolvase-like protein [bacterium]